MPDSVFITFLMLAIAAMWAIKGGIDIASSGPLQRRSSGGALVMALAAVGAAAGFHLLSSTTLAGNGADARPSTTSSATTEPATTTAPTQPAEASDSGAGASLLVWVLVAVAVAVGLTVLYRLVVRVRRDTRAALDRRARAREVRARQEAQWQAWVYSHHELTQKVVDTETDWDTMFSKPALTDMSVPVVAEAYEAYRALSTMDSTVPRRIPEDSDVADWDYPRAVAAATAAWEKADQYATRVGQDLLPEKERRTLRRIRALLSQAEDEAASVHERQLAYQQVQRLLGTLRHVTPPPRALAQLEASRTGLRLLPST